MFNKGISWFGLVLCITGSLPLTEQGVVRDTEANQNGELQLHHIGKSVQHLERYAPGYHKYKYMYSVHDPHTGDEKAHHESSDGKVVTGTYWLIQPDGKKRTVTYTADESGYHAHVEYTRHHEKHTEHHGETHAPSVGKIIVHEVTEIVDEKPIEPTEKTEEVAAESEVVTVATKTK